MTNWQNFKKKYNQSHLRGDRSGAIKNLRLAIEHAITEAPREVPMLYNALANALFQAGEYSDAEVAARESIEIEIKVGPPPEESDHLASYYIMLTQVLEKQNRYIEALPVLDRGIALFNMHIEAGNQLMTNLTTLRKRLEENSWRG